MPQNTIKTLTQFEANRQNNEDTLEAFLKTLDSLELPELDLNLSFSAYNTDTKETVEFKTFEELVETKQKLLDQDPKIYLTECTAHVESKENLDLVFMSDMHLGLLDENGEPDNMNDFMISDQELSEHMLKLLQKGKIPVFLGDFAECWQHKHLSWREPLEKVLKEIKECAQDPKKATEIWLQWHKENDPKIEQQIAKSYPRTYALLEKFLGTRILRTQGNHDPHFEIEYVEFTVGNFKIFGYHGHQAEKINAERVDSEVGSEGRAFAYLGGFIEELVYKDVDKIFSQVKSVYDKTNHSTATHKLVAQHSSELAQKNGYKIVVNGHTHKQSLKIHDGFVICDDGDGINSKLGEQASVSVKILDNGVTHASIATEQHDYRTNDTYTVTKVIYQEGVFTQVANNKKIPEETTTSCPCIIS